MSSGIVDCPYCERRVLSINGICPGCNRDLNDTAAAQRHILKRKASAIAMAARAQGASLGEIETQLIKVGIDEELIKEIMMQVEGKTPQALEEKNAKDMRTGFYWLVGGILVTAITYLIAALSGKGGAYIIAWGAIFFGAMQFVRSLLRSRRRN